MQPLAYSEYGKSRIKEAESYGGEVILTGYSRGALESYCSSLLLDSGELRNRVHFIGVGGAALPPVGTFKSTENIVNSWDWVPRIANPWHYCKAMFNPEAYGLTYVQSDYGFFSFDHSIWSPSYQRPLGKSFEKLHEKLRRF